MPLHLEEHRANLTRLQELLAKGNGELAAFLREMHPADLAELIEELPELRRVQVFRNLGATQAALVLGELDLETQADLVQALGTQRAGDILEEMGADDAADLLAELTPEQAGQLLGEMEAEDAAEVRELLHYNPDTAGGIMTTDIVAVNAEMTAHEAIEVLRREAPEAETIYYVYVVDRTEHLVGVLSLRDLIIARPEQLILEIMRRRVVSVRHDTDQEEVARIVAKYDLLAVPVVDHENRLLGVVTVDDAIDVIQEEATEDALRMSGITPAEEAADQRAGIWALARPRLPWLVMLLFLELVAAQVIARFQGGFDAATLALLAIFIPVMAGEAGNGATQALAVVVRGLATGEIHPREVLRVVWRELRIGLVLGGIAGLVLFAAIALWQQNLALGLVGGVALAINLPLAKTMGALFPIVIQRLGIDPAVASGPFITTVTDVTSMLTYFGVASYLLLHLS